MRLGKRFSTCVERALSPVKPRPGEFVNGGTLHAIPRPCGKGFSYGENRFPRFSTFPRRHKTSLYMRISRGGSVIHTRIYIDSCAHGVEKWNRPQNACGSRKNPFHIDVESTWKNGKLRDTKFPGYESPRPCLLWFAMRVWRLRSRRARGAARSARPRAPARPGAWQGRPGPPREAFAGRAGPGPELRGRPCRPWPRA